MKNFIEFLKSKFMDMESLEESRTRIRAQIAHDTLAKVYPNIFFEGDYGCYRGWY